MNTFGQDLHFDVLLPNMSANSSKQVLRELSEYIARELGVSKTALQKLLWAKEEEQSSGIGNGVAIPHIQLRGPQQSFIILARLQKPIDFKAIDEKPVDLICLVLSPEKDGPFHLRRLARVSRLLTHQKLCDKLREARSEEGMRAVLIDPEGWLMAA